MALGGASRVPTAHASASLSSLGPGPPGRLLRRRRAPELPGAGKGLAPGPQPAPCRRGRETLHRAAGGLRGAGGAQESGGGVTPPAAPAMPGDPRTVGGGVCKHGGFPLAAAAASFLRSILAARGGRDRKAEQGVRGVGDKPSPRDGCGAMEGGLGEEPLHIGLCKPRSAWTIGRRTRQPFHGWQPRCPPGVKRGGGRLGRSGDANPRTPELSHPPHRSSSSAFPGGHSGVSAAGRWLSAVSVHVRHPPPRPVPPIVGAGRRGFGIAGSNWLLAESGHALLAPRRREWAGPSQSSRLGRFAIGWRDASLLAPRRVPARPGAPLCPLIGQKRSARPPRRT